jgi:outer membrane protein OmpA-like peptidoglycan-associated protein
MNRVQIIEELLFEGFTEKTLSRLGDKQLSILAKTVIRESDVMISKKDPQVTQKIDAAKKQNKSIETYEEKEIEEENEKEIEEWVLNLAETKYSQFTSKKDIMSVINEKMETFQPMPSSKPKKGHNDVPEFMTYDSIISSQPSISPSRPDVDTPVKPKTPEKPVKPRTPFRPGPVTKPKPKALSEKKKEKISEALGGDAPTRVQSTTTTFTPGKTVELGSNLFKIGTDKIDTNSNEFKNALDMIKKSGANGITIQGGASSVGSPKYDNQALADRRAYNFKNALINAGIKNIAVNVVKGIVTPNTDTPNSPEANKAQFVRITHTTSPSLNTQSTSALDNATISQKYANTQNDGKTKSKQHYINTKITFPTNVTSKEIMDLINTHLKGKISKIEKI